MKMLLSTTAIVIALGFPNMAFAQTTAPAPDATTTAPAATTTATEQGMGDMPGFLATRGQTDLMASELIGRAVYSRRNATDTTAQAGQTNTNADGNETRMTIGSDELGAMDNIGEINEIILSSDGEVRAIVIGVGGFLGMGERDVAVTMDQVSFAADRDNADELYVMVNTSAEALKTAPAYDRTAMMADDSATTGTTAMDSTGTTGTTAMDSTGTTADRTPFTAPTIEREGYQQVVVQDVTSEMLTGKAVYSVNDESVGTIDDLVVDANGSITNVIIDFGGFLGMGTSQVSVGYDELTVLADEARSDVRVYVDATKEQVQAQPQYMPAN